jgi:hypothetical protein
LAHNADPPSGNSAITENQIETPAQLMSTPGIAGVTLSFVENSDGTLSIAHGLSSLSGPANIQETFDSMQAATPAGQMRFVSIDLSDIGCSNTTANEQQVLNAVIQAYGSNAILTPNDIMQHPDWSMAQWGEDGKQICLLGDMTKITPPESNGWDADSYCGYSCNPAYLSNYASWAQGYLESGFAPEYFGLSALTTASEYNGLASLNYHNPMYANAIGPNEETPVFSQFLPTSVAGSYTTITTADVDAWREASNTQGSSLFMELDNLSANDPRLVLPTYRDQMTHYDYQIFGGLAPDVAAETTLHGLAQASVLSGVATGISTTLTNAVLAAKKNSDTFKRINEIITATLNETETQDLLRQRDKDKALKNKKAVELDEETIRELLRKRVAGKLRAEITHNTLKPGLGATATISTSLFALANIFPPAYPVLSGISFGVGGVGLATTGIATLWHRHKINKAVDKFFNPKLKLHEDVINKQVIALKKQLQEETANSKEAEIDFMKDQSHYEKRNLSLLSRIANFFSYSTIGLRITAMAKYTLPLIGKIAGAVSSVITTVNAAVTAVSNYKNRQKRLSDFTNTVHEASIPKIHKKRFWFFGKTKFDEFVEKEYLRENPDIKKITKQDRSKLDELKKDPNKMKECFKEEWRKKIIEFALPKLPKKQASEFSKLYKTQTKPLGLLLADINKEYGGGIVRDYARASLDKYVKRDVRVSGILNTAALTAAVSATSMFVPLPFTSFVAAAGTAITGGIVTEVVARREANKFKQKFDDFITGNNITSETTKLEQRKLQSFLRSAEKILFTDETATPPTVKRNHVYKQKITQDMEERLACIKEKLKEKLAKPAEEHQTSATLQTTQTNHMNMGG